jgi:hypothetical protein
MNVPAEQCLREKCDLALEGLRSFGELHLRASGVSMLPTLLPGDLLVIRRTNYDEISAGDIVLFRRDDSLFVHRVVESDSASLMTGAIELLGKVISVERDGCSRTVTPRLGLFAKLTGSLLCHSPHARSLFLRLRRKRALPSPEIDSNAVVVLK